jgi:hypothetical protein
MQSRHVIDVHMHQHGWICVERAGAAKALSRLPHHNQAVGPEKKLGMPATSAPDLRQAFFEAKRLFEMVDGT